MSLVASALVKDFGGLRAVDGVSVEVDAGTIVGLVGSNGAGKTTCFNLISGFIPPTAGTIEVDGVDVTHKRPDLRVRHGLVRTFQHNSQFSSLSVEDNVATVLAHRYRATWHRILWPTPPRAGTRERTSALLDTVGLSASSGRNASELAYGDQRRLSIALALATDPTYLLLDEPAAGLNPHDTERLAKTLGSLRDQGLGVLLVEHDMTLVMGIADKVIVIDLGRPLAEGTPADVRSNRKVQQAYFGEEAAP